MTDTSDATPSSDAARELLRDSFERTRELVTAAVDGLSAEQLAYRPDAQANSIDWLVWHALRVQDNHVAELVGDEEVWTAGGYAARSGLGLDPGETGYGMDAGEVGEVQVAGDLLEDYAGAVHVRTLEYVGGLDLDALAEVVDERWDPPVTASARLVSVVGDVTQHLGQAAYVRGLVERR